MALFYVSDEGSTRYYPTMEEARADAEIQIDVYRDNCDPEWSLDVESVAVYECDAETDEPEEDGRLVLRAQETNRRDPEPDDCWPVEYFCDYAMMPPKEG